MKFDTHCHVHEGSVDSLVRVEKYIELLIRQQYDGMIITDHNTYNGYRHYVDKIAGTKYKDFVVLRGIEYDTYNAGHFIVIMPTGEEPPLLEQRGLRLDKLIKVVHDHGGILGPAHPFGENFLSIYNTGRFKRHRGITKSFDFIEGFNSNEDHSDNVKAMHIASIYDKPVFSGSDSHMESNVGRAATFFDADIRTEDDLIAYIKSGKKTHIEGSRWYGTLKDRLGKINKTLVYGFFLYNKAGALLKTKKRIKAYREYNNE